MFPTASKTACKRLIVDMLSQFSRRMMRLMPLGLLFALLLSACSPSSAGNSTGTGTGGSATPATGDAPPVFYLWQSQAATFGSNDPPLAAYSSVNGNKLWEKRPATLFQHLLLSDGVVYAAGQNLDAYQNITGKQLWEIPLPNTSATFLGATPDRIILADDNLVYGIRKSDGSVLYRVQDACSCLAGESVNDDAYVVAQDATTLYVGHTHSDGLYAINVADGTRRWSVGATGQPQFLVDRFLVEGGNDIAMVRASDGSQIWDLHGGENGYGINASLFQVDTNAGIAYIQGYNADPAPMQYCGATIPGAQKLPPQDMLNNDTGQFYCAVHLTDGKPLWEHTFPVPFLNLEGIPGEDIPRDPELLFQPDIQTVDVITGLTQDQIQAIHMPDGKIEWTSPPSTETFQSIQLAEPAVIATRPGATAAFDMHDGHRLWEKMTLNPQYSANVVSLVSNTDLIIYDTNYGAGAFEDINPMTGNVVWSTSLTYDTFNTYLRGEVLYIIGVPSGFSGLPAVTALNIKTGALLFRVEGQDVPTRVAFFSTSDQDGLSNG